MVYELIRDGRFGHELGGGIQALIPSDESTVSDHEFRVLYGDGYWYALYSIARGGIAVGVSGFRAQWRGY